ncbi:uncharacterized protein STEHIDRAFT_157260 [Stereum hirsutum FP-91666 SS1]|uniref:uncharacterized protein n=1 Tax=Stereum hirsutum (strain FP-91666) TaxID=721885 RepID=UPI0004449944|nr:uncharacterized protein STEHIDRAFT_157260 [Stereum hirsutum FP-91666 SS1]EIM86974.1 hypothetical protein STEHIDRAFT_157260 [Stereum hirsutum FP-91666 SS1]
MSLKRINQAGLQCLVNYPQATGWPRLQQAPELLTQILDDCDNNTRVAMTRVSKLTPARFDEGDVIYIRTAPMATQWKSWLPLAEYVKVFQDNSLHDGHKLTKDGIQLLNTTRPVLHIFPNLHTVYIFDYNFLPIFMSPNLSIIHLTMTQEFIQDQSHISSIASALKDYCPNITELHIYSVSE